MKTSPSSMKTLQFECVKVALKQDKTGYILTLSMHPDEIPEELMRDFVGARYQVVMVRVNESEQPMDRTAEFDGARSVKLAGIICRDERFWEFLCGEGEILDIDETQATDWLRDYLHIKSRSELATNQQAREKLDKFYKGYIEWKKN